MKNIKSKLGNQSISKPKQGAPSTKATAPMSKSRQRVFSVIAVVLPIIFLVILELLLRLSGYGDNHSLFVNHRIKDLEKYYEVNPEIGKKYFNKMGYSAPAKDMFLKKKPDDVFRIFAMGSSSVAGFPYDNNLMFSRILSERLRDVYPDKKIEMVNTAITAINSFTLADFMPQIIEQKPDAILIYAGHNEFYGAFGAGSNEALFHSPVMIRMHLALLNYKVYQLTVNTVGRIGKIFNFGKSSDEKLGTLMTRMVKDADITFGSKIYKEGITNYEQNLDAMLSLAKKNNVQVFISDLVSNLRDLKPFKSIATAELKGAEEYYELAKKLEAQGDIQKAKENYILARDYDCIRFRASSDINSIIQKLADKYQAHFVPTVDLFAKNSTNGIVGNNLLTEHLHPNIPGQFLLAESFYKEITQSKLIAPEINTSTEKSYKGFIQDYGYSNLDYMLGKHRVTNLSYHWPFVDESKGSVDYREIYKPVGIVDSLAFTVMAKLSLSLPEAHMRLGEMYMKKGDMLNAFKEYNSLTKINPYWSINFRKAGDCLLQMNNLPKALRYFERSMEYTTDVLYAHFCAGEIFTIKNDLEAALLHFQKAQEVVDPQLKQKALIKIYQTLVYLNRAEEGKDIQAYFNKINPGKNIPVPPRTSLLDYIPMPVKAEVEGAMEFMAKNNTEKAIELLENTFEIEETSIAFRLLGELYLKKGAAENAQEFLLKAYPDYQFEPKFLHYFIVSSLCSGKPDVASKNLEQLKKIDPNYAGISKLQGYINGYSHANRLSDFELQ
jgi:tetratricopeptide (TPR) repeat protein/lysophospholipase L1-like esterase